MNRDLINAAAFVLAFCLTIAAGVATAQTTEVTVFTCNTLDGTAIPNTESSSTFTVNDPRLVPHCQGTGQWRTITVDTSAPQDPEELNAEQLGFIYALGFVTMATGLLLAGAVRVIISLVRERW